MGETPHTLPAAGRARLLWAVALLALLCACAAPEAAPAPLMAPAFELLTDALTAPGARAVSVLGYLVADAGGMGLAAGLRYDGGGPQPLPPAAGQVCLESASDAGGARPQSYTLVVVSGQLEGPGAYGQGGACSFLITGASVTPIAPRETSIEALLKRSAEYAGGAVRVTGALLARPGEALLVEALGDGGAPAPGARQIKLAGPLRDAAVPPALGGSASGDLRFGRVQVEGVWRDGALAVLSIAPLSE